MKILHVMLIPVFVALFCSCDDGSQKYSKFKVESDIFVVTKNITEADTAKLPLLEPHDDYNVYGEGDKRIYVFNKDAEFVCYRDEDWEYGKNLLIKDGEVLDSHVKCYGDNILTVLDQPGLIVMATGDYTHDKDKLTLGEYQALLNETCPPKAQARRQFMWGNIIVLLCFIVGLSLIFAITGYEKNDKAKENAAEGNRNKRLSSGELVAVIIGCICLFAIPVVIWLYYYQNPDESFWYITDWGFLGFCLGLGYVFATVMLPCCSVAMLGPALKKTFSKGWKGGLLELAITCVAMVLAYYFLALVLPQLWEQCGFIFKSIGVITLLICLPGGVAAGLKKNSGKGPSIVSDGNGNNLEVVSSDGNRVITSDGKTRYRRPDGSYHEL